MRAPIPSERRESRLARLTAKGTAVCREEGAALWRAAVAYKTARVCATAREFATQALAWAEWKETAGEFLRNLNGGCVSGRQPD